MNLDQTERPARWSVSELIDFEVALDRWDADDSAGVDAFKSKIALAPDARTTNRSAVFLAWLKEQATPDGTATAGQQFERGVKAVLWLALFIGGLVGVGTTAGLLAHDSAQPINAALFLAGTVGLQIGMLLVALVAVVARAVGVDFSPLTSWMHALVRFSIGALNRLHGEQRAQAQFVLAKTGQLSSRLAPFISLQVLQLTQAFVIAFNLGILGSMLFVYLPFVELRFGWQSTYSFGADGVFRALQAIALPWSWISDSLAPSGAGCVHPGCQCCTCLVALLAVRGCRLWVDATATHCRALASRAALAAAAHRIHPPCGEQVVAQTAAPLVQFR